MIYTYLHTKEIKSASWHVAHLYEHLYIQSFYNYMSAMGISPAFVGSINAETFHEVIFIEAWFYTKKIALLYESFIKRGVADESLFAQITALCEAEEKSIITIANKKKFKAELLELQQRPWKNNATRTASQYIQLNDNVGTVILQKSANSFRSVNVIAYNESADLDDQVAMLRLSLIASHIIVDYMRSQFHAYTLEISEVQMGSGKIGLAICLSLRKGIRMVDIKKALSDHFATLDIGKNMSDISRQVNEYRKQNLWKDTIITNYRQTGIMTNQKLVATSITKARVEKIFRSLIFVVEKN